MRKEESVGESVGKTSANGGGGDEPTSPL